MSTHRPSYRDVLRTSGIRPAFLPSLIGRLSLATSGLALVFLLEDATASFTIAGIVTAILGLANVVATPWRARLIGYLAADDLTDARVRTEASSWINTAVNFGAAIGAVVYGARAGVRERTPARNSRQRDSGSSPSATPSR